MAKSTWAQRIGEKERNNRLELDKLLKKYEKKLPLREPERPDLLRGFEDLFPEITGGRRQPTRASGATAVEVPDIEQFQYQEPELFSLSPEERARRGIEEEQPPDSLKEWVARNIQRPLESKGSLPSRQLSQLLEVVVPEVSERIPQRPTEVAAVIAEAALTSFPYSKQTLGLAKGAAKEAGKRTAELMASEVGAAGKLPKKAPEGIPIGNVIAWRKANLAKMENPLDITFEKQSLADLMKAKKQGRTSVPEGYFKNPRTQQIEIPPDLAKQAPKAEPVSPFKAPPARHEVPSFEEMPADAFQTQQGGFVSPVPKGDVGQAVREGLKQAEKTGKAIYAFPTADGMKLSNKPPDFGIQHIILRPDGSHQVVQARFLGQIPKAEMPAPVEGAVPPVAPAEGVIPPVEPPKTPTAKGKALPPEAPKPKPFRGVKISDTPVLMGRATSQTVQGKAGQALDLPGVRKAARWVSPVAQSNQPATVISSISGQIDDQIAGGTAHMMAKAKTEMTKVSKLLKIDAKGISLADDIKQLTPLPNGVESRSIHDMIEFAPWYDFGKGATGKARLKAVNTIRETSEQMSNMLRNEGILVDAGQAVKPGQIRALEGEQGWSFLHRVVNEVKSEKTDILFRSVKQTLTEQNISFTPRAGESSYQYLSRFARAVESGQVKTSDSINELLKQFSDLADVAVKKTKLDAKRAWKTVAEGLESGVTYEPNPLKELEKQVRASYELVKKKRLAEAVNQLIDTTTPAESALKDLGMTTESLKATQKSLTQAKRLRVMLNRAVRGERVPIDKGLADTFPDETNQIKSLVERFQEQPIPETATEVKALESKIQELIDKPQKTINEFKAVEKKYTERMSATGTVEYGRIPGMPGLGNRVITSQWGKTGQEVADELRKYFGYMKDTGSVTEAAGKLGALMRMGKLGFDMSASFIQQAMSLGYDIKNLVTLKPTATWAKATGGAFKSLVSKNLTHLDDFLIKNSDVVVDFIERGGLVEGSEFTEAAAGIQKLATRAPQRFKLNEISNFIAKNTFGRSDAVFTTGRVEAAVNMYKAGLKGAADAGQLDQWARMVNDMTGVLSTRAIGVSARQRNLESAFVLLSPRFTRANGAIIYHILTHPNAYTSKQAAQSLTALIAAGTALYLGGSAALGKDSTLNPFNRDFGNLTIGKRKYRIGGILNDLKRMLAVIDSATYMVTGKNVSLSGKEDNTPTLDRVGFQQFQSKTSPVTGTTIDIIRMMTDKTARDWEGRPLTWQGILGNWISPAWMDPLLNEEKEVIGGTVGEIFGLTTNELDMPYELKLKWKSDFKDYEEIPAGDIERKAKGLRTRTDYRKRNPEIDAKLFIAGEVSSLQSLQAVNQVLQLIEENQIEPDEIKGIKAKREEIAKREELGVRDTTIGFIDILMRRLNQ